MPFCTRLVQGYSEVDIRIFVHIFTFRIGNETYLGPSSFYCMEQ